MADRRELDVVGKPLVKVDAAAKVSGQTLFADDIVLPRMAFARMLRSPHPHARIRSVDVSRAAAHPGVLATLVGAELPIPFGILPVSQDEHALALSKVRFVGDPVAAVAALDEETAEEAVKLVDVDYEVLPPVMSIEEALERPEPRIHEYGPQVLYAIGTLVPPTVVPLLLGLRLSGLFARPPPTTFTVPDTVVPPPRFW